MANVEEETGKVSKAAIAALDGVAEMSSLALAAV